MLKQPKFLGNEDGQALFEFVVFLPLVLVLSGLLIVTGNSINASINQQKATRGYFYFYIQNNSRLPNKKDLENWHGSIGLNNIGHFSLGWSEKLASGSTPFTTCFKYNALFGDIKDDETCDEPDLEEAATSYIRPATAYGVCSESYSSSIDGDSELRVAWLPLNGAQSKLSICANR